MNGKSETIVEQVYQKIVASETEEWSDVDDYLDMLGYLDDDQLGREASVLYHYQGKKNISCEAGKNCKNCFMPELVKASGEIISSYEIYGDLDEKGRYVLEYYLSFFQAGMIVVGD